MGLVAISWMIRIARRDGKPDEEQYCADEQAARELIGDLNEPDNADMYRSIELIRIDWLNHTEQEIEHIDYEEENT